MTAHKTGKDAAGKDAAGKSRGSSKATSHLATDDVVAEDVTAEGNAAKGVAAKDVAGKGVSPVDDAAGGVLSTDASSGDRPLGDVPSVIGRSTGASFKGGSLKDGAATKIGASLTSSGDAASGAAPSGEPISRAVSSTDGASILGVPHDGANASPVAAPGSGEAATVHGAATPEGPAVRPSPTRHHAPTGEAAAKHAPARQEVAPGPAGWWVAKRRRCYEILERDAAHDRIAERVNIALIVLIVLNVVVAVLETVPSLLLRDMPFFRSFEIISLVLFALEYALRLWSAPENPRYRGVPAGWARLRHMVTPAAIIDLVAWLPFLISMLFHVELRTLAIFRLLRFVKLARYSPGMQSLLEVLHRERQSLMACFWLLAASVLIAASAMYVAEGSVQPQHFGSIPAAMWWAMTTVTTVGYGDTYPMTPAGKVIASLTMITGIIMIALPVGIIATAFVDVIKRRDFVITWGMVARVPLFADLDAVGIGEIHKALSAHVAQPGEVIVRRGETARSMYFIASGEVLLEFPHESVVFTEGQFFGEMALVHSAKRAATARARTRSMLLMLDAADLSEIIHRHPEIGARIAAMARDVAGPHPLARRSDIASGEIGQETGEGTG
ncbi:ion transporter [Ancylobacter sp. SL191]|uniref:ion transporter n=1 Tax=Ancylobacter sp. SL191 TaxID=2995166 RepID=UPI002271C4F9|nr:ion transporter [Ancylobacter sp. SL191]WAC25971.1 ion transporter [Ancylobacter sp. SL191]